jgi:hypothetical protein
MIKTGLTEPMEDRADSRDVEDIPSEGTPEEEASEEETSQDKRSVMCARNQDAAKHTLNERKDAYAKFYRSAQHTMTQEPTVAHFSTFLTRYKGMEGLSENDDVSDTEQLLAKMDIQDVPYDHFTTELGEVKGLETVAILNN